MKCAAEKLITSADNLFPANSKKAGVRGVLIFKKIHSLLRWYTKWRHLSLNWFGLPITSLKLICQFQKWSWNSRHSFRTWSCIPNKSFLHFNSPMPNWLLEYRSATSSPVIFLPQITSLFFLHSMRASTCRPRMNWAVAASCLLKNGGRLKA